MASLHDEKTHVPSDFDRVAGRYDRFASMNPGYAAHLRLSAARLRLGPGARILDLCCGTGLSTEALDRVYPDSEIVGMDASVGMLERAKTKRFRARVRFEHGDAMDPRGSGRIDPPFDGILMAYGIRNMPDPDLCLSRLIELLPPGGRICFHEFALEDTAYHRALWDAVSYGVIIPGGFFMGGGAGIYRYLRRSVAEFDRVHEFEARLVRAGFEHVATEPMDGWQRGILHSFVAKRPR
jgi:ubiquinone/menaquinone biosynthesis C-methylase UbiE